MLKIHLILMRIQVISLRFTDFFDFFRLFLSYNLELRSKKIFFAVFGWYFTPWIQIQEAKIFRILKTAR